MVENYTKDLKESIYHGVVVSVLAIGYSMLGRTLIKMSPPSLSKFDVEDGVKLVRIVAMADFTKGNALAFSGSNFLFSSLSKESIDKERKRHDKAIEDLQRAQIEWAKKRQERLDYINNQIIKERKA